MTVAFGGRRARPGILPALLFFAVAIVLGLAHGRSPSRDLPTPHSDPAEPTPAAPAPPGLSIDIGGFVVDATLSPGSGVTFPGGAAPESGGTGPFCGEAGGSGWPGVVVREWGSGFGLEGES